jgi:hypothetical protein
MRKRTTEFIAKFMGDLSKEGLIHGSPARYRRGYPNASDEEVQMLFDAGEKAGAVPHNLEHARLILSDNVFVFPAQGAKRFDAFRQWPVPNRLSYPAVAVVVMARTMQEFAKQRSDGPPDLLADAVELEQRALDALKAGLSEIRIAPLDSSNNPDTSPRPPPTDKDFDDAALAVQKARRDQKVREAAMARTLKIVAEILTDTDSSRRRGRL